MCCVVHIDDIKLISMNAKQCTLRIQCVQDEDVYHEDLGNHNRYEHC